MSEQKKVCECGDVDCLKGSQSFTEASAARAAPAEGIAIGSLSREAGSERIVLDPIGDPHIKDGMVVYTAPAALQAEVERLKEEAEETLRASQLLWREVERLKADAERYRWLRNNGETERGVMVLCVTGWEKPATAWATTCPDPETLDACIDDEIARTAKPEEGCPLCNGDCSAANPPVTNCPLDASAKPEVKS